MTASSPSTRRLIKRLSTGLQLFYERCAAAVQTALYPTVTLILIDSNGHVYENKHLTTAYQPEEE